MSQLPDFDPYELLGLDGHADAIAIDRAYKARVRRVHPDVAGNAGLAETKRLNIAREWLTDPQLRAQLPLPPPRWSRPNGPAAPDQATGWPGPGDDRAAGSGGGAAAWTASSREAPDRAWDGTTGPSGSPEPRPSWSYDPPHDDPLAYDFGPHARWVRAFMSTIRSLTDDDRARLTYGLGDEAPPTYEAFRDFLGERLWSRARALHDAVSVVWHEREDELAPFDFPKSAFHGGGPAVTNAYAQWHVLGQDLASRATPGLDLEALRLQSERPWEVSVGRPRYGSHEREVRAFIADARRLTAMQAERLARSWQHHMGRYLYGTPGEDWFPGTRDHDIVDVVGARVATVDVSRILLPEGLDRSYRTGFQSGLRLTVFVLALGGLHDAQRDYLRPWREAMDPNPSFLLRTRLGTQPG